MTIKTLNTYPLGRICGARIDCGCGAAHTIETKDIAFGAGALDALPGILESLTAPLVKACIVSDKTCFDTTGVAAERLLLTRGFKCVRHIYGDGVSESVENSDKLLAVPEDTKALIAVGGGKVFDMAKYAAVKLRLPVVGVVTSPSSDAYLSPFSMLYHKGFKEVYVVKPPAGLIADTNAVTGGGEALAAAGYGLVQSKRIALFDWAFSARLTGEKYCPEIAEQAEYWIAETVKLSDGLMAGDKNAAAALCEAVLRLSLLSQALRSSRLSNGGETHLCHALEGMLEAGQRPKRLYGENLFLSAVFLSKAYCAFLKSELTDFIPPPDLSVRAEKLAALFNASEAAALARIRPYMPAGEAELFKHKFREYRADFLSAARKAEQALREAQKVYNRLYSDAGFWMKNYLRETDYKSAFALAPDLREKYTVLTYMRDLGLLDRYLV